MTEAPNAMATVCAIIEVALGPVSRDTVVYLLTPITGSSITGEFVLCSHHIVPGSIKHLFPYMCTVLFSLILVPFCNTVLLLFLL